MEVRAKKHLGQHFLKDKNIAQKIADSLLLNTPTILEIGAGTGVLTQFLKKKENTKLLVSEVDDESIEYLIENDIISKEDIVGDFLKLNLAALFKTQVAIIGNFPYNISSQIVFKTIENKELIPEFAGMFQKEVAERICASPGNKQYGIISVLTQAYYNTEYLFTVDENVFTPPPRVKSGVIRLSRKEDPNLGCNEKLFKQLIKTSFNTRRKMLRVSLKRIIGANEILKDSFYQKRPEQLSVQEFITMTNAIESALKS